MRQRTSVVQTNKTTYISKLPMRQRTLLSPPGAIPVISKLPMRQRTVEADGKYFITFSKLPMRQRTDHEKFKANHMTVFKGIGLIYPSKYQDIQLADLYYHF